MRLCSICKIGQLAPGAVTVTLERGASMVLLKKVPTQVCDNCSSYFLDAETTGPVLQKAYSCTVSSIRGFLHRPSYYRRAVV